MLPSRDPERGWRWHLYGKDGTDAGPDDFPGARALRGERVVPGVEMRYRTDDRTEIWTQVAAVPVRVPDGGIVGQVSVVTDIDRQKRADEALRDSEARLREALDGSNLLHAISTELIGEQDVAVFYDRIAAAAVQLMHAPVAALQMLDEDARGTTLQLLASHGLPPEAAGFWQHMRIDPATVWDGTLAGGRRVVVPDTAQCAALAGTPELDAYRTAGIRAMQATPLRARSGKLLGMISTCWPAPHVPSELSLRLLDILARQAADLIERTRTDHAGGCAGA